jgi:hypothetical protein
MMRSATKPGEAIMRITRTMKLAFEEEAVSETYVKCDVCNRIVATEVMTCKTGRNFGLHRQQVVAHRRFIYNCSGSGKRLPPQSS